MDGTKKVIELIEADKLVHKEDQDRKIMTHLERIGLLVSVASRDDVSDSDKIQAVKLIKELVDSRHSKFNKPQGKSKESIRKMVGINYASTYIYLMHHGVSDVWKIGRSKKPKAREKTLQHQDPMITLNWKVEAVSAFEAWLHGKFKSKRLRGEWFELSGSDVSWIKNESLNEYNLQHG